MKIDKNQLSPWRDDKNYENDHYCRFNTVRFRNNCDNSTNFLQFFTFKSQQNPKNVNVKLYSKSIKDNLPSTSLRCKSTRNSRTVQNIEKRAKSHQKSERKRTNYKLLMNNKSLINPNVHNITFLNNSQNCHSITLKDSHNVLVEKFKQMKKSGKLNNTKNNFKSTILRF